MTGETFQDPRPGADHSLLGIDEWELLSEICGDDPMQLELLAKLMDTERQYHLKGNRKGIYEALEKCFNASSRDKQEALDNAYFKRDLREKAKTGDVDEMRKLLDKQEETLPTPTWASIKFKTP